MILRTHRWSEMDKPVVVMSVVVATVVAVDVGMAAVANNNYRMTWNLVREKTYVRMIGHLNCVRSNRHM